MFGSLGLGFASTDCEVGKYGVLVQHFASSLVHIFYGWSIVPADGGIANAKFIEDVMLQFAGQLLPKELVLGDILLHVVATLVEFQIILGKLLLLSNLPALHNQVLKTFPGVLVLHFHTTAATYEWSQANHLSCVAPVLEPTCMYLICNICTNVHTSGHLSIQYFLLQIHNLLGISKDGAL